MDILQKMTPEQISALTPECLKILMQQDSKHVDIERMRNFFNSITYDSCFRKLEGGKNTSLSDDVEKILQKYSEDNFYIHVYFPENDYNSLPKTLRFKLFTEQEAILLLPTGCELNKITFNGTNFPPDLEKYIYNPYRNRVPSYGLEPFVTEKIYNLCFKYDNACFIHPDMLLFAKHFYS